MALSVGSTNTLRPASSISSRQEANLALLLAAAVIVVMVFHLLTLTKYPRVFVDEGWLANASWTWLTTGVNFDAMHTGTMDQFGYEWVTRYFIGQVPYVVAFQLFGLGVFQSRLVAWFFGAVLLLATIQVGRRTYGLKAGLLAALLLTLSLPFLQASRFRQDIILAAFVMLALWLALMGMQDKRRWPHLVAGMLLGFGLDIHQMSAMFIPALAALYLTYYGRLIFFKPGTWLVGIGGAVGVAFYLAVHILPSPEVYNHLMSFTFAAEAAAQIPITNPATLPASLLSELGRYGFRHNLLDLGLIIAGGLLLLIRRTKTDRLVLVFTGVAFIDFVLFSGNKTGLYAIHMYPLFMLIVAELVISMLRQPQTRRLVRAGGALALALLLLHSVYRVAQPIIANFDYDYYAITNRMRAVIPADARVMAMPMWWFGLADNDFRSGFNLSYYAYFNDYSTAEALETMRPDYIVFDELQAIVLVDEGESLTAGLANVYSASRPDFMGILNQRGEMLLEFTDPWHGYISVYRLDWSDPEPE